MKIFSIIVFRWYKPELNRLPTILSSVYELSSFGYFQRGSVKEVVLFVSREVVSRGTPGEKQSVKHSEYFCHSQVTSTNVGVSVITDGEYPARVAFGLIAKTLEEFQKLYASKVDGTTQDADLQVPALEGLLKEYQDPTKSDSISKIQKDLDETKEVLVKSIDQLLVRGEKLDALAEKSNDLSFQSKAFLKQSEKMNSCCTII